jgi:hypothetical protein
MIKTPDDPSLDLLQGTLDMLILRTLQWGPQHGHGIGQAIRDSFLSTAAHPQPARVAPAVIVERLVRYSPGRDAGLASGVTIDRFLVSRVAEAPTDVPSANRCVETPPHRFKWQ